MKQITITFKGGKVAIATKGYAGAECLAATARLKTDMGFDVESVEKTAEYGQATSVAATAKVGQ
jgi:hypothetical protein